MKSEETYRARRFRMMWAIHKDLFVGVLMGLCVLVTVIYSSTAWYIGSRVYVDTAVSSDVVIILGARSYLDSGEYNPCLVARVAHGVSLYDRGLVSALVVTGGTDELTGHNEAQTMRDIAEALGVPSEDIYIEPQATSTYENLIFSGAIMDAHEWESAIIVSEPFHMPRAHLVAEHLNIDHTISPARGSVCWERWKYVSRYFIREVFALWWYIVTGKV